jgi:hypothetical protein
VTRPRGRQLGAALAVALAAMTSTGCGGESGNEKRAEPVVDTTQTTVPPETTSAPKPVSVGEWCGILWTARSRLEALGSPSPNADENRRLVADALAATEATLATAPSDIRATVRTQYPRPPAPAWG